ncbi:MAG: hypothetical protein ACI4Q4_08940, partial [Oscillospiraceae bacterium]
MTFHLNIFTILAREYSSAKSIPDNSGIFAEPAHAQQKRPHFLCGRLKKPELLIVLDVLYDVANGLDVL